MLWAQISACVQGGMKSYTWRTLFRTTHNHPRIMICRSGVGSRE